MISWTGGTLIRGTLTSHKRSARRVLVVVGQVTFSQVRQPIPANCTTWRVEISTTGNSGCTSDEPLVAAPFSTPFSPDVDNPSHPSSAWGTHAWLQIDCQTELPYFQFLRESMNSPSHCRINHWCTPHHLFAAEWKISHSPSWERLAVQFMRMLLIFQAPSVHYPCGWSAIAVAFHIFSVLLPRTPVYRSSHLQNITPRKIQSWFWSLSPDDS